VVRVSVLSTITATPGRVEDKNADKRNSKNLKKFKKIYELMGLANQLYKVHLKNYSELG